MSDERGLSVPEPASGEDWLRQPITNESQALRLQQAEILSLYGASVYLEVRNLGPTVADSGTTMIGAIKLFVQLESLVVGLKATAHANRPRGSGYERADTELLLSHECEARDKGRRGPLSRDDIRNLANAKDASGGWRAKGAPGPDDNRDTVSERLYKIYAAAKALLSDIDRKGRELTNDEVLALATFTKSGRALSQRTIAEREGRYTAVYAAIIDLRRRQWRRFVNVPNIPKGAV